VNLVCATRNPGIFNVPAEGLIQLGASPRATIYLTLASKAHAFLRGRGYVTPQDVKAIAPDVMRHRIQVSYEAEAEDKTSDHVLALFLDHMPVP
jgi:MoxR-like ATPase